jgi:predicted unusual protein kinase regulating ubiquinone biosynthesis (AarF/ABC1/UbiB family)
MAFLLALQLASGLHLPSSRSLLRTVRPYRSATASMAADSKEGGPYPLGVYDPDTARSFFTFRPLEVLARASQIAWASAGFGLSLAVDYLGDELDSRAEERAVQLCTLLTNLGPTFIKIGQSASVRTDLFPPVYTAALTSLQDALPPFSSDEARRIIADELGVPSERAFSRLSPEPIAAASLGQVYRGALANGTEVAVKVQRPNVERQIALDMLLIRDFAAPVASAVGLPGDLVGTADAWGVGFVDELRYS